MKKDMNRFINNYLLFTINIVKKVGHVQHLFTKTYLLNKQTAKDSISQANIFRNIPRSMYSLFECITFLVCGTMGLQHSTHLTACSHSVPGELKLTKVLTH